MGASRGSDHESASASSTAHPDDDVTPAQRAYGAAFVDWLRSGSETDHHRRDAAFIAMMREAA